MILADVHIAQAGAANCLHILIDHSKLVNFRENLFQTVLIKYMSAVHGLDHLARCLALAEAGDHNLLAGLHVSGVHALFHQFFVDLDNDGSLIAILLNALHIHVFLSS